MFLRIIAERKRFDLSDQLLYGHALRTPVGSKANAFFQRCFSIVEIWLIAGTPHCDLFRSVRFKIQINIFVADRKAQEVQHPRPTADARHNFKFREISCHLIDITGVSDIIRHRLGKIQAGIDMDRNSQLAGLAVERIIFPVRRIELCAERR